jgi:hypothetical protein
MPPITKQQLEARLVELRQSAEELKANLSATVGAIQTCEYLLAELEKPEPDRTVGGHLEEGK